MIKRINTFRIVFNFLLSLVELFIGVCFLINIFGSSSSLINLLETVRSTLWAIGAFASGALIDSGSESPIAAVLLVLGFMLFGFILIVIVPAVVERKEKELELMDEEELL